MDKDDKLLIDQITTLNNILSKETNNELYGPVNFWESLSEKHKLLLINYGFNKFKRTINFEYNQWGVQSLKDYKIRRLIKILPLQKILAALILTKANRSEMNDIYWPDSIDSSTGKVRIDHIKTTKLFPYIFYLGLLWQYALINDKINCLKFCEEPTIGGPLPIRYKGKLISQDLALSAIELNFM